MRITDRRKNTDENGTVIHTVTNKTNGDGTVIHTVTGNDTLDSIMKQYEVTMQDLKALNRISQLTGITKGTKIRVK